jgi:hypothetical protein
MARHKKTDELYGNKMFRERFQLLEEREGLTSSELALRIGWLTTDRSGRQKPDSSRVTRLLGLVKDNGKLREEISYDNAVILCNALHIEYTDAGV